jgi:hypothetical protein
MIQISYLLCALTSALCAALLARAFARSRVKLLFWSALCFACFTAENLLVFADLVLFPDVYITPYRLAAGLLGISLLLFGLITEGR